MQLQPHCNTLQHTDRTWSHWSLLCFWHLLLKSPSKQLLNVDEQQMQQ
jgi:hypothetical protein